jgi:hypothetical protein
MFLAGIFFFENCLGLSPLALFCYQPVLQGGLNKSGDTEQILNVVKGNYNGFTKPLSEITNTSRKQNACLEPNGSACE